VCPPRRRRRCLLPSGTFTQVSLEPSGRHVETLFDEAHYPTHACALSIEGDAHCWGSRNRTSDNYDPQPAERLVLGPFVQVSAGGSQDCALDAAGVAWCWESSGAPTAQAGVFSKIGAGGWYEELYGLGLDGTVSGRNAPPDETFVDLAVGGDFACGLRENGTLRCFGSRVR